MHALCGIEMVTSSIVEQSICSGCSSLALSLLSQHARMQDEVTQFSSAELTIR